MNAPILQLQNVGVKYRLKRKMSGSRYFWAVKDVSLDLHEGESLGVLGSNGAGKSTLMKLIAGIISHDRGKMLRNDSMRFSLLSLGVGFESNLTGRENALMSGMLLGLHYQTIAKRLGRIQEFSELGDFFDQPIYTYSSGMISRLGFSVALETEPDVLLLDEVFSVGDAAFQEKSAKALHERFLGRKTVVLISHDLHTIQRLCQSAVWINHGQTICSGTVEEVAQRYLSGV
ncbi:MAG: ABC transporter ATP-binding protein [bacterium]